MIQYSNDYGRKAWPVVMTQRAGALLARIECAQCGGHSDWTINSRKPPPEILPKHFSKAGWKTTGRPTCPDCMAKQKEPKTMTKTATVTAMPIANNKTAPTYAARQAKKLLFLELMDHYDDAAHCYRNGKTDAGIAKDLGVSEQFVRSVREVDFGPLSEPSEFADIRAKIDAISDSLNAARQEMAAIIKANGWQV